MATRRAKAPKRKTVSKKPEPAPAAPDLSFQEMRAEATRSAARRRVAAFMERTSNLPWMRQRLGSFELALIGGLKNLIAEAEEDEVENRSSESYSAHYSFLYSMFTSLRYLFFWKALESRLEDLTERLQRPPSEQDVEETMRELEIFNAAASRDDVQARFRQLLTESQNETSEIRKRILEQAYAYDVLNTLKDIPKA